MFNKLKQKIERERDSLFWGSKFLIFIKDFIFYNIYCYFYILKNKLQFLFLTKDFIDKDIRLGDLKKKIDLTDVTFVIPVRYDSTEREENLNKIIDYLNSSFDTRIIVGEEGKEKRLEYIKEKVGYEYFPTNSIFFHKTRVLNNLTKLVKTKFVAIYDADVLANPLDMFFSLQLLREGKADVVYPFNGVCLDLTKEESKINISFENIKSSQKRSICFGGACITSRDLLFKVGMQNENFISWGMEDDEIYTRLKKFGYKIIRTPSSLMHLFHPKNIYAKKDDLNYLNNFKEFDKVKKMSKVKLLEYIKIWDWAKNNNLNEYDK